MVDDLIKSIKLNIYERVTSPLLGTFVISWCLYNYRLIIVVLSSKSPKEKFDLLDTVIFNSDSLWYRMSDTCFWPLIVSLIFIFVYPYPAKWIYGFWRSRQKELKEKRQEIDNETLLSEIESKKIKKDIWELGRKHDEILNQRDEEISHLKAKIDELEEEKTKNKITYPRRVKATQKGYLGDKIREQGAVFMISEEEQFSNKWMVDAPVNEASEISELKAKIKELELTASTLSSISAQSLLPEEKLAPEKVAILEKLSEKAEESTAGVLMSNLKSLFEYEQGGKLFNVFYHHIDGLVADGLVSVKRKSDGYIESVKLEKNGRTYLIENNIIRKRTRVTKARTLQELISSEE